MEEEKERYKMTWTNLHKGRKQVATVQLHLFRSKLIVTFV